MSYTYNFILKKTGASSWGIFSEKGNQLYEITRCTLPAEAMSLAKAWASSWHSAIVRFEDEKHEKRD